MPKWAKKLWNKYKRYKVISDISDELMYSYVEAEAEYKSRLPY